MTPLHFKDFQITITSEYGQTYVRATGNAPREVQTFCRELQAKRPTEKEALAIVNAQYRLSSRDRI